MWASRSVHVAPCISCSQRQMQSKHGRQPPSPAAHQVACPQVLVTKSPEQCSLVLSCAQQSVGAQLPHTIQSAVPLSFVAGRRLPRGFAEL